MIIDPKEVSTAEFHGYLLGTVMPRPIAFASTIDKAGHVNLSPFSFFNVFSANPPILIFSPARRVRDNTIKHTLENVMEVGEVVVNIVNYSMVEQMSLASTEYEKGVDEFIKSGLNAVESVKVRPPRVKESPAAFECLVREVKPMGQGGGAGNLVICEIILAHISDIILGPDNRVDPVMIDVVARLGGNWYNRVNMDSIFEIEKPLSSIGIGVDSLPANVQNSRILTGNNLGRLGNCEKIPSRSEIAECGKQPDVSKIIRDDKLSSAQKEQKLHLLARQYIDQNKVEAALKILLQPY